MRTKVQDINVDLKNEKEALDFALSAWNGAKSIQIVTLNPEMVINASKNADFKEVLNNAELVIADGIGITLALKLKKINIERIAGINFSKLLLEKAQNEGKKVALIGAKEEVLRHAVENIKKDLPELDIAIAQNGYFDDENAIVEKLEAISPDLILTATGSPKQEFFNYRLKKNISNCILIGVGGSFDVFAGIIKRAPAIWQKMGLEWLYRTIKEPSRFKRIFPVLPIFIFRGIIESVKDRV